VLDDVLNYKDSQESSVGYSREFQSCCLAAG